MKVFIAFALLVALSMAHSTKYPDVYRNETCFKSGPAKVFSYHIHLLYLPRNNASVEGAYRIREDFRKAFSNVLGSDCHALFH
jgi:hypothetical protein